MTERKKIIVGAWKAYLNRAEAEQTAKALKEWRNNNSKKLDYDIVLSPSFPYLMSIKNIMRGTNIALSAQDVDSVTMGAYTGHIPPQILLDVGCKFVILGHSELRHLKQNDYKSIHQKVKVALEAGLQVILCVGETKVQKVKGATYGVLKSQIESAIVGLDQESVKNNLSIAYEPVWAISSQGPVDSPKPEEISAIHKRLRSVINGKFNLEVAETVRILYGGSVNADNVCGYLNAQFIDGVLVGSASTKIPEFTNLLDAVEEKVMLPAA